MIKIPGMMMVGAGDRNSGKTEFGCSLIRKFGSQHNIIGIKVTTIEQANSSCPRGGSGCGVCSSLESNYCIKEETDSQQQKDTCRMLAKGATRVFWLRSLKAHLEEGITALQNVISYDAISVCESNSLRQIVEPGLFIMLRDRKTANSKTSAGNVARYADEIVLYDGDNFDIDLDQVKLNEDKWTYKIKATAIIMAGGKSERMGQDKSMLLIDNKPLIKHIFDQLYPHFSQIIVSSNDVSKYSFLGVEIVPDRVTGQGPLMGIASALRASVNEMNFVIACDIPEIDIRFVRSMIKESRDFDAVVPQTGKSRYEPLFGVYKKSAIAAIDRSIASGNYRMIDSLRDCKVNYIDVAQAHQIENLNTKTDYLEFIGKQNDVSF